MTDNCMYCVARIALYKTNVKLLTLGIFDKTVNIIINQVRIKMSVLC